MTRDLFVERAARRAAKLLAQSKSDNKHEAASAKAMADALIKKHGLDAEALSEDEVDVTADREYTPSRLMIAVAVARATRCITAGVGWIAFRGRKHAAETAANTYQALVRRVAEDETRAMRGAPASAVEVWRACYVMGFVPAVEKRLAVLGTPASDEDRTTRGAPSDESWQGGVEVTTPDELKRARMEAVANGVLREAERLAELLGDDAAWDRIDRLRTRAHRAGAQAGGEVEIPFVAAPSAHKPPPKGPAEADSAPVAALPPKAPRWRSWRERESNEARRARKDSTP